MRVTYVLFFVDAIQNIFSPIYLLLRELQANYNSCNLILYYHTYKISMRKEHNWGH